MTNDIISNNQGVRIETIQGMISSAIRLQADSDRNKESGKGLAEQRKDLVVDYVNEKDGSVEAGLSLLCSDLKTALRTVGLECSEPKDTKRQKETAMRSFKRAVENATEKAFTLESNKYNPTWKAVEQTTKKSDEDKLMEIIAGLDDRHINTILRVFEHGKISVDEQIAEEVQKIEARKLADLTRRAENIIKGKGQTVTAENLEDTMETIKMMER